MTDRDTTDPDGETIPDLPPELETERYSGEESALTPEELDITESDHVAQISENRYVVSSDPIHPDEAPRSKTDAHAQSAPEPNRNEIAESNETAANVPGTGTIEPEAARGRLLRGLSESDLRYGVDIVATFDQDATTHQMLSDDVVANFEGLLWWYARNVTDEVPPDEALGVLLMEASLSITYPTENVGELLSKYDLGPDDSIRDLLRVLEAERRRE